MSSSPASDTATEPSISTLKIDLPHTEGGGEDAPPVAVVHELASWVGVFDGMGGAGATSYQRDGESRSGAYIASRAAATAFRTWASERPRVAGADLGGSLHVAETQALHDALTGLDSPRTRLRSGLLRALPTTLAVAGVDAWDMPSSGQCTVVALWAGDSRIYLMVPGPGLVQLTRDHLTSGGDAQDNLGSDSPLSNCLSADGPSFIEQVRVVARPPFVLIAATDGCFGYVAAPVMFEELILNGLDAADSLDNWRELITESIAAIAGDDVSLVMALVGWRDFDDLPGAFRTRAERVRGMADHIRSATAALGAAKDEVARLEVRQRAAVDQVWEDYRRDFEPALATTRYGDT